MHYFHVMTPDQQREAVQRLIASGMAENTIAAATALSVEMVRRLLSESNVSKGAV